MFRFPLTQKTEPRGSSHETRTNDAQLQQTQLAQFLFWMTIATFFFSAFEGIAFLFFKDGSTGSTALMLGLLGSCELFALYSLRRKQLRDAIIIYFTAMSTFTVIVGFTQPFALPALIACALLPLGVALPYLEQRTLTRMICVSWGIALGTVAIIRFAPHPSLPKP